MGSSFKPEPPAPPDPYQVANVQTGADIQTAIANTTMANANEVNPYGSLTYNQSGTRTITIPDGKGGMLNYDVPQYTRTQTLSPQQQALLTEQEQEGSDLNNLAINQTARVSNLLSQPITTNGLPALTGSVNTPSANGIGSGPSFQQQQQTFSGVSPLQTNAGNFGSAQRNINSNAPIQYQLPNHDYGAQRDQVTQAILSRVNPQLDRDRSNLETKLVNQGLVRGSTAFNTAMDESNRQANDAYQQAVLAGGQEQSRLAGLDLQAGNFANTAQAQDFGEGAQRQQAFNAGQGQDYTQGMGNAALFNTAQGQQFGQNQQLADFYNQAAQGNNQNAQQAYLNQVNATQLGNEINQQAFANQQAAGMFGNTARQQALQEQLSLRNQPINEITALLSGGQVNVPQFQNFQAGTIAQSPLAQSIYGSAGLQQQNYQSQMANVNATLGAIGGVAGAGLYGYMQPPRR